MVSRRHPVRLADRTRRARVRCCALGILAIPLMIGTSHAAALATGADLARACRDVAAPGPCINYLLNVADGQAMLARWGMIATRWCMPEVGYQRLRADFLAFFDAHPALAEAPVNEAVAQAFAANYPCPQDEP